VRMVEQAGCGRHGSHSGKGGGDERQRAAVDARVGSRGGAWVAEQLGKSSGQGSFAAAAMARGGSVCEHAWGARLHFTSSRGVISLRGEGTAMERGPRVASQRGGGGVGSTAAALTEGVRARRGSAWRMGIGACRGEPTKARATALSPATWPRRTGPRQMRRWSVRAPGSLEVPIQREFGPKNLQTFE
jgi:hypothetical protein